MKYVLLFTLQVKYTQDQKQMKGRPSLILDTPGLRHVKEAQNRISMVGSNRSPLRDENVLRSGTTPCTDGIVHC